MFRELHQEKRDRRFDLTYEGLKSKTKTENMKRISCFDLTYEGLKYTSHFALNQRTRVLILPMRD